MTLAELLQRAAHRYGERDAVWADGKWRTYSEIWSAGAAVVAWVEAAGVARGGRIMTVMPNGFPLVAAFVGLTAGGYVWVRASPELSASEIDMIAESAEPALVLAEADRSLPGDLAVSRLPRLCIRERGDGSLGSDSGFDDVNTPELQQRVDHNVASLDAASDATIWYTSGTTGRPKGIVMTQGSLCEVVRHLKTDIYGPLDSGAVLVCPSPLYWTGSIRLATFFASGAKTVILNKFSNEEVLHAIDEHHGTHLNLVPTTLNRLTEFCAAPTGANFDRSSLQLITYGGSPILPTALKHAVEVFGPILSQTYAQAEVAIAGTTLTPEDHALTGDDAADLDRLSSAGYAYSFVDVKILDSEGNTAPPGEVGEIAIGGRHRMRGYWRDQDQTDEVLRDGWVLTGDLGRMDDTGRLYVVGRKKDMIITGGINVYATEVEAVVGQHPNVHDVAVVGMPDEVWGEKIVAVVTLKPGAATVTESEVLSFCRGRIAAFKIPKRVVISEQELPRNQYGKVMKQVVAAQLH